MPDHRSRATVAIAIILGIFVGVTLLGPVLELVLLIFAGLLVAAFLHGGARWLATTTHLPHGLALAVVCLVLVGVSVGWILLVAPSIAAQLHELRDALPLAIDRLADRLGQEGWGGRAVEMFQGADELVTSGRIMSGARSAFSIIAGGLGAGLLILFVGLFVAVDPGAYRSGLLRLVPVARRAAP